jgi:hypothetical protein
MQPETLVIACPACRHTLRVPLDWLGQSVQCPECRARFKAPVRDGDALTSPELIAREPVAGVAPRKRFDAMLLLPAFGLLLCGVMGVAVNGILCWKLFFDQNSGKDLAKAQLAYLHQFGFGVENLPPGEKEKREDDEAEKIVNMLRWVLPLALALSFGAFLGGLSIAVRWNYRLAQAGCVLASLNLPHLCCIPGAVAGVWALLMLNSEEGREHFRS